MQADVSSDVSAAVVCGWGRVCAEPEQAVIAGEHGCNAFGNTDASGSPDASGNPDASGSPDYDDDRERTSCSAGERLVEGWNAGDGSAV